MEQDFKLEVVPYPIKFMFGGFFIILGLLVLLFLALLAANSSVQLGSGIASLFSGNKNISTNIFFLLAFLALAAFYFKSTSLKISQNQLVFTSYASASWRLDISQLTEISYCMTPARQNFTLSAGRENYTVPFRVMDPAALTQSLKAINPKIQVIAQE